MVNVNLWGQSEIIEDIKYLFKNELNIGMIIDEENIDIINNFIIVCSFEYRKLGQLLERKGLIYGKQYEYAHKLPALLLKEKIQNRLLVWKSKYERSEFVEQIQTYINDASYNYSKEIWIIDEDDVDLVPNSFQYERDFLFVSDIENYDVEVLLKKAIYSERKYRDIKCAVPFNMVSFSSTKIHTCCGGRLPVALDLRTKSFDKVWFGLRRKILCLTVVNGSYAFCNKKNCPILSDYDNKNKIESIYYANGKKDFYEEPRIVQLEYDATCNLQCPSCRRKYITKSSIKCKETTDFIIENVIPRVEEIRCAGYGEALFSKNYLEIMFSEKSKGKNLYLLTNGLLISENVLNELINHYGSVKIDISVDAACADTYKKIRKGDFETLLEKLLLLKSYRDDKKIDRITLNSTISRINVKEMQDFVNLASKYSADGVRLSAIHNWGNFTAEEFDRLRILNDEGDLMEDLYPYFDGEILNDNYVLDNNIGYKGKL